MAPTLNQAKASDQSEPPGPEKPNSSPRPTNRAYGQSEPLGSENPAPKIRPTNKSSTVIVNNPGDLSSTPVNTQIDPKYQSKSLIDNFLLKISNLVQKK